MDMMTDHGLVEDLARPEVVWVFRRNRKAWLEEWQRGERSGEFFYGLLSLRDRYRAGFVEDNGVNPLWRPWYPIELLIARKLGMGFALHVPLWHVNVLNRARVVISTVDACGLPLALLKRLGVLRSRLIYISQGLSDRIAAYGSEKWLSRFYRRLLLGVDQLVTFSPGAQQGLADWLGVRVDSILVCPFGTDCAFWHNTAPPGRLGDSIVSVGSDAGRDYQTLLAASGDLPLHIITRQHLPVQDRPTVTHTTEHSPSELRDIYSSARFVVIPLHDLDQPSGQSAALQAMACGKAVILTKTRGWWGETILRDDENCVAVPPGSVEALRHAMERLWSDPELCAHLGRKAREIVVASFSEARMAERLSDLIATTLKMRDV